MKKDYTSPKFEFINIAGESILSINTYSLDQDIESGDSWTDDY